MTEPLLLSVHVLRLNSSVDDSIWSMSDLQVAEHWDTLHCVWKRAPVLTAHTGFSGAGPRLQSSSHQLRAHPEQIQMKYVTCCHNPAVKSWYYWRFWCCTYFQVCDKLSSVLLRYRSHGLQRQSPHQQVHSLSYQGTEGPLGSPEPWEHLGPTLPVSPGNGNAPRPCLSRPPALPFSLRDRTHWMFILEMNEWQ